MPAPHIVTVGENVSWINEFGASDTLSSDSSFGEVAKRLSITTAVPVDEQVKEPPINAGLNSIVLPPIRVHSPRGRELETDSVFQRNLRIYKLCHMLGLPESLVDWRFPKGHVPSKPDFSRNAHGPQYRHTGKPMAMHNTPDEDRHHMVPSSYHVEVQVRSVIVYFCGSV